MGDEMRVDAERLAGAAGGFDVLAARLASALATLDQALAADGECWGKDAPGATFAAQYVPGDVVAHTKFHTLTDTFAAVAAGLVHTAETFDAADTGIARTLGGNS